MNKSNRTLLCLLIVSLTIILLPELSAQTDDEKTEPIENSLAADKWALMFQIDQYFTLTSFEGTMLSVKRHFSSSSALRFGFSATFGSGDASGNEQEIIADTGLSDEASSSSSTTSGFTVNLQYLLYPNPGDDINLFLGAGPLIQLSHNSSESNQVLTNSGRHSTYDRDTWYLGVSGAVGVEWFATRSLSFHGEYGAAVQYITSTRTQVDIQSGGSTGDSRTEFTGDSHEWRYSSQAVKFGVSAYF